MKKNFYLLVSGIFLSLTTMAQNGVPNGSFETWNTQTYDMPQYAFQTSNTEAFFKANAPFNSVKTADSYHGAYAIKLTTEVTNTDAAVGYFIDGNPQNGNPSTWAGGIPYTQKPSGIRGYYKSAIPVGDTGLILLDFKKAGTSIGFYALKLYGTHSAYTLFSFTLSPALPMTPDSLIFGCASSDIVNNIALDGSMLQLDSISFTGVASQPAQFNGDFETWESQTLYSLPGWFAQGDNNGGGVYQTTDAVKGTYAVELKTFVGQNNNQPAASGSQLSTGYYNCQQSGPCTPKGGYPFTNMIDTFSFYYKYVPSGNDSAQVGISFIKNGTQFWGVGMNLGASASYTKIEIPFALGSAPDTAVIQFQSSVYKDTALSFVGSDLKIDEAQFKSQPLTTGLSQLTQNKQITVYPNPSRNGTFVIANVNAGDLITVYNVLGQQQPASIVWGQNFSNVNLAGAGDGVYFMQVNSNGKIFTSKIAVKR